MLGVINPGSGLNTASQRDELVGRHQTAQVVTPTQQRFNAADFLRLGFDDRLVVQREFAVRDGIAKADLYGVTAPIGKFFVDSVAAFLAPHRRNLAPKIHGRGSADLLEMFIEETAGGAAAVVTQ